MVASPGSSARMSFFLFFQLHKFCFGIMKMVAITEQRTVTGNTGFCTIPPIPQLATCTLTMKLWTALTGQSATIIILIRCLLTVTAHIHICLRPVMTAACHGSKDNVQDKLRSETGTTRPAAPPPAAPPLPPAPPAPPPAPPAPAPLPEHEHSRTRRRQASKTKRTIQRWTLRIMRIQHHCLIPK